MEGYWCVVCGRFLLAKVFIGDPDGVSKDDDGLIVHDNVPHPEEMTFDEEEKPQ